MSHRIKRFAAFAIFALFYHFAAVDSILGFYRHQTDTKTSTATTRSSLSEVTVLVSTFAISMNFYTALSYVPVHLRASPSLRPATKAQLTAPKTAKRCTSKHSGNQGKPYVSRGLRASTCRILSEIRLEVHDVGGARSSSLAETIVPWW